ncbi:NMN/ NaMN adenylyltransferase [Aphelenchoides avenae]|nr:NMN/ NaMN adenylyltransferase [Aphelenchus avenae]
MARDFGVVVIARPNTNPVRAVYALDILRKFQRNVYVIDDETNPTSISSTKLRTAIRRGESIRYCISDDVVDYIQQQGLYQPYPPFGFHLPGCAIYKKYMASANVHATGHRNSVSSVLAPVAPSRKSSTNRSTTDIMSKSLPSPQVATLMRTEPAQTSTTLNGTAHRNGTVESMPTDDGTQETVPEQASSSAEIRVHRSSEESQRTSIRTRSISPMLDRPGNISPTYDNLTLDEILEASCKWVEYFEGHSSRLSEMDAKERSQTAMSMSLSFTPAFTASPMPPPSETTRSLPLPEMPSSPSASPQPILREPPPRCGTFPSGQFPMPTAKRQRTIRFGPTVTKSSDDLSIESDGMTASEPCLLDALRKSKEREEFSSTPSITLTFRQYRLTATPETTV